MTQSTSIDYAAIFAQLPGMLVLLSPDLDIVAVSDEYARATLTPRDKMVGRPLFDVFPQNPTDAGADTVNQMLRASFGRVLKDRKPDAMSVIKYDIQKADGGFEARYWSLLNAPILDGAGAVAYVLIRAEDVTEFVRLRSQESELNKVTAELRTRATQMEGEVFLRAQQLQVANEQLRGVVEALGNANRAKSDFLAMMSHELRTPLNSIIGFSEVLLDGKFGGLTDQQTRFLGNVHSSGRHLLGLINDLLDFSKIEAGRLEVTRQPCAMRLLAHEAAVTLQPLADAKQITLTLDPPAAAPLPPISADPVRCKQVLYNFLSNAIKFTSRGGNVEITCGLAPDHRRVRASIRDDGPGIRDEDQKRLFKPFVQLDRIEGSALGGTGLGLALTKQMVELMGGVVGMESTLGSGATFFVDLPIDESATPEPGLSFPLQLDAPLALIVDDDPAARELMEIALRNDGFRTEVATTGEGALVLARRLRPAVVILDVFLPGMDGWEVLRALRRSPETATLPVVMATISNERQKAFSLGAIEHLVKPVERKELLAAIRRHGYDARAGGGAMRVLVVDDDVQHLGFVRAALEPEGYSVHTEASGHAGLAAARAQAFDLVLLDLVMPDLSGIEFVAALRGEEATRALPIVLITANEIDAAARARLNGDVQVILGKDGLSVQDLLVEVKQMLGRLQ